MVLPLSEIIGHLKTVLAGCAPDARSILYGSYARGEAREDSDVDLLVLLPDELEPPEFVKRKLQLSGELTDLSIELGVDISPLVLVPKVFFARKTPFTINVMNEGIEL